MIKNILITNADTDLGRTVAKVCTEQGLNILLTGQQQPILDGIAEEVRAIGGRAIAIVIDLSNEQAVEQLQNIIQVNFGELDVVFHLPRWSMSIQPFDVWSEFSQHVGELLPLCRVHHQSQSFTVVIVALDLAASSSLIDAAEAQSQFGLQQLQVLHGDISFLEVQLQVQNVIDENSFNAMIEAFDYVLNAPNSLKLDRITVSI